MMLLHRFLPNERKFIGVSFNFCTINKNGFLINEFFLYEFDTKLHKTLANEFFHIGMNAETIDRTIAWLISLCEPHHTYTIP
ncbi:Uncharacterised protein [Mycobacteroides abscessus subsp. abscessus]|nr:Uncharacterised protein [Mycobacteroides abscessus subsp. abscessus]